MRSRASMALFIVVLVLGPATTAQRPDSPAEVSARLDRAGATDEGLTFACEGCPLGWVWTKVEEAWRYEADSEERIWVYFRSTHTGSYAFAPTADTRARLFIEAASSAHWIGLFHTGTNTFTNVRLWYY